MFIFIRGISKNTKKSELGDFISPALVSRFHFIHGKVLNVEILMLEDKKTKLTEFHGLVNVDSDRAGRQAIKRLNGKMFKGHRVVVREYVDRAWQNDRRSNHMAVSDIPGKGNRRCDRRRHMLVVESISHLFSATKEDARKLI
jgi:RNA recognition motif-containing protein